MSATATTADPEAEPRQEESTAGESTALTTDEAFELLSNHRRRYAIHHLQREGTSDIGGLSRQVAAWENGTEPTAVTSAERKRVYTSLQQFHLPKLDEKGVVEYDERAGEVTLSDGAEGLDVYLEVVGRKDVPWSQYYLGLAAVNAALLGLAVAGVWPFATFSGVAWGVFAVTSLALSAGVHTYYNRSMQLGETEAPPSTDG